MSSLSEVSTLGFASEVRVALLGPPELNIAQGDISELNFARL